MTQNVLSLPNIPNKKNKDFMLGRYKEIIKTYSTQHPSNVRAVPSDFNKQIPTITRSLSNIDSSLSNNSLSYTLGQNKKKYTSINTNLTSMKNLEPTIHIKNTRNYKLARLKPIQEKITMDIKEIHRQESKLSSNEQYETKSQTNKLFLSELHNSENNKEIIKLRRRLNYAPVMPIKQSTIRQKYNIQKKLKHICSSGVDDKINQLFTKIETMDFNMKPCVKDKSHKHVKFNLPD